MSAVQFRPGTLGENSGNWEIAGGSAIGGECQNLSESDAVRQSLTDRNATIDPEGVEFANALAEHTLDAQSRVQLQGIDPAAAVAAPPRPAPAEPPVDVLEGTLRVRPAPSKNELAGGYRGVRWNEKQKQWQATVGGGEVKANGRRKQIHLGFFDDAEVAARAYDVAAEKAFGSAARLNFPREGAARPPKKTSPYIARKRAARGGDR